MIEKAEVEKPEMMEVLQKHNDSIGKEEEECCEILLHWSVMKLQFGDWEEQEIAVGEIKTIAKRGVKTCKLIMEFDAHFFGGFRCVQRPEFYSHGFDSACRWKLHIRQDISKKVRCTRWREKDDGLYAAASRFSTVSRFNRCSP